MTAPPPTAAERAGEDGHYLPPPAGASCLLCGYATTQWAIWSAHGVGLCVSCRDLPNRLDAANAALLAARRELTAQLKLNGKMVVELSNTQLAVRRENETRCTCGVVLCKGEGHYCRALNHAWVSDG